MQESTQEELFPIPGYENIYAATKTGKIWSYPKMREYGLEKGKWISHMLTYGYQTVKFHTNNSKPITIKIHRIIAKLFIPNPEKRIHINLN